MTDALAKDDAESVLASIRRLVVDQAPPPKPSPDRFLLTPALRVVEAPKAPAPAAPFPAPEPHDEGNDSIADDASIARLLRSLARSEAPAILAETLTQNCGVPVTGAFAAPAPPEKPAVASVVKAQEPLALTPSAQVAPPVRPVAQAPASVPSEPAPTAAEIPPSALADEAFLREIVADVLRQELQGELGERITRNMRKLVRREINRALSQLDYD